MFTEIVKLTPNLDRSAMNKMFKTLNQRFSDTAKRFGQGIKMAMKLAPFMAIAGAILSKILNPLQKAEEIIDKILGKAGDVTDTAEELGSDPGTFMRMEAAAAAKGVDAATFRMLLGKFQSDLAQERLNEKSETEAKARGETPKTGPGLLREFTEIEDTSVAFFEFIQSMQRLDKDMQTIVQNTIFGERVRGRAAAFFNEKDFAKLFARLPTSEVLSGATKRLDDIGDVRDLDTVVRETEDYVRKSKLIQVGMVKDMDTALRQENKSEDETLIRYDSLKSTSIAIQELTHKFDKFTTELISDTAPMLLKAIESLTAVVTELMPYLSAIKEWTVGAFDSTIEAIANFSVSVDGYWQEFKKSRVYRWFGRD